MATLGTPPAGWYTDPSGQHRARYWDGAGWTEQVRDDVGAPSAVSGGEQAHEAAATVANIAQALVTVAEQDVAEPVFVVDYGTADPASVAHDRDDRSTAGVEPFGVGGGRLGPDPRLVSGPVDAAPGALLGRLQVDGAGGGQRHRRASTPCRAPSRCRPPTR